MLSTTKLTLLALASLLFVASASPAHAQGLQKNDRGVYTLGHKKLEDYEAFETLYARSSPEALTLLKKSRRQGRSGMLMTTIGGALLGSAAGLWLTGTKDMWPVAVAGVPFAALGLGLSVASGKTLERSAEAFNRSRGGMAMPTVWATGQGAGASWRLRF